MPQGYQLPSHIMDMLKSGNKVHLTKPEEAYVPMSTTSMHASTAPLQSSIRPNHSNMMNMDTPSIGNKKIKSHGSGIENASTSALPPYSYNGNKAKTVSSLPSDGSGNKTSRNSSHSESPFYFDSTSNTFRASSERIISASQNLLRDPAERMVSSMMRNTQRSSMAGKRSASSMPVATSQTAPKRSRFSQGLSAIVSKKKASQEVLRRKKRGDL